MSTAGAAALAAETTTTTETAGAENTDAQSGAGEAQTSTTTGSEGDAQSGVSTELWYKDLPAERHAYIENKGWKSPNDVLDSYTNIEKTLGLPADARSDALLVRPKADAKPEEQAAFLDKALKPFVPESADKYDLGIKNEEMPVELKTSADWMHKAGVPQPMAQKLAAEYLESKKAADAAFEEQSAKDMKDLATELGDKFGDFEEMSRRAFRAAKEQSGLTIEQVETIEKSIGTKQMLKLFGSFGKNMTELPGPGGGNNGKDGNQFGTSPAQAKASIDAKFRDSEFMARYNSPDQRVRQTAIAEMEALQKAATGTA